MGSGPGEQLLWRPEEHSCLGNSTPPPPLLLPILAPFGAVPKDVPQSGVPCPAGLGGDGGISQPYCNDAKENARLCLAPKLYQ